ncbi:MAG TPA: S41 family peptidase [Steroidobacteraceae bacterium]|nr:S41 family peptidase [Steroidobacteraceae bacterium]
MKSASKFSMLLLPAIVSLAGCGGGDETFKSGDVGRLDQPNIFQPPGSTWTPGSFLPASTFKNRCANPRSGTSDLSGTVTDENNWLRSWTNDTYLWFTEVTDRNPALFSSTLDYFALLKTTASTASGAAKDKFHFTYGTEEWQQLSQGGITAGYGASFEILAPSPPRRIVVAFVDEDTPAFGELFRGDEILEVDGQDAVNGNTEATVFALNGGLFPAELGENHTFVVRGTDGMQRTVTLGSEEVFIEPTPVVQVLNTGSGNVGYLLFNDHSAPAEDSLATAIQTLDNANVTDLILDIRYNGGGYLDIASEAAYMIANPTLTSGQTFERLVFNSKHPSVDPVTGETITPTPFHSTKVFGNGSALPNLGLGRVYVITGPGTCSASEAIINGLRGVGVQVYVIGSTTCGKPYGFYPTDNCGTTYFSIQFRGENDAGFGDYTDGFSPVNTATNAGTTVPGCSVADDFTHELGDPAEGRIAAALSFRSSNNQTCPAATGFTDPRLSKMSYQSAPDRSLWVSKPAARMNRILRRVN